MATLNDPEVRTTKEFKNLRTYVFITVFYKVKENTSEMNGNMNSQRNRNYKGERNGNVRMEIYNI